MVKLPRKLPLSPHFGWSLELDIVYSVSLNSLQCSELFFRGHCQLELVELGLVVERDCQLIKATGTPTLMFSSMSKHVNMNLNFKIYISILFQIQVLIRELQ